MPIPSDVSGSFGIDNNRRGNLVVSDSDNTGTYFSTDVRPKQSPYLRTAKLYDNGNLVLTDDRTGERLWESFKNPTDTFLPGMKMDETLNLTSWKSEEDPAAGNFSFRLDEEVNGGYSIEKYGFIPYWKSGGKRINSFISKQMSIPASSLLSNTTNSSRSRLFMKSDGEIEYLSWDNVNMTWSVSWSEPKGPCSVFKACGSSAKCNPHPHNHTMALCTCLPGYEPTNEENWKPGDNSQGCKKISSECTPSNTSFVQLNVTMVRSNTQSFQAVEEGVKCISLCQNECACQAYSNSYNRKNGCWFWSDDLNDIQEGSDGDHHVIFIRVDRPSVNDQNIKENQALQLFDNEDLTEDNRFGEDDKKDIDVPFYEFQSIVDATDNFADAYKLGQGGFGPVYKGKFPGGEEIAVKRLSSNSGQGLKEFKNEVVLIAKLQHRNLVRLLGYCIKGKEKILLYEYMPNKSLDAFIFDEKLSILLNWARRFDIITGVARGLLYLHQDSRLRIIHRDMKASNILLDDEMNPKISDFGLARIVGRRDTESNTTRVMGTYGYMAPEYAVEGQFSVKSDAFSFGVVVLEMISGKKNTGFFKSELALSLLGYAWNLWKEEKPLTLLDETLVGSCNESEVLKCIIVGLLCVQEDPNDRPDMSKVVFMLSSETETLPNPKQPAFVTRKRFYGTTSSSSTKPETLSNNEITFSEEDGR
ncbi:hypothetical protein AgCh_038043 [Apium graveolens]